MQTRQLNERVRLTRAVPELSLEPGSVGVVQSVWHAPTPAYEVEFRPHGAAFPVRALILAEHVEAGGQ